MNRVLTVFTLSFLVGIILVTNGADIFMISGLVLILLISALFVFWKFKRLFIVGIAIGIVLGSVAVVVKDLSCLSLKEGDVPLCTGVVVSTEEYQGYTSSTIYLYEYRQKVMVTVQGEKKIKVNDLLELKNMKVALPDEELNDGTFDYRKHLKSTGINYIAKVDEKDVRIYGNGGFSLFKQAREINFKVSERIKEVFGNGDIAGVIGGIFIGNKSLISQDTYDYMIMAGISHIMAVSGLHIMLMVTACYVFCESFGIRDKAQKILIVSVLVAFAAITGMSSSVIRAAFMVILVFVALSSFRDNDSITTLSLAALVLSCFNPYVIYHMGFQMSFLATFAIVVAARNLTKIFEKFLPSAVAAAIALSISAQMGILSVMVYANGYITMLTLLANLICVPLLPFIYLFGSIALVTGANPFTFIAQCFVKFIIFLAKKIALSEFNQIYLAGGVVLVLSSIFISLSFIYIFSAKDRWKKGISFLLCGMVVFGTCTWYNLRVPENFTVTFLNVEHGDCTLIRGTNGENMLIDTGTEEMADYQVVPYLNRQGIRKIDTVVLSHFDSDHAGGFEKIVKYFAVEHVIVPFAKNGDKIEKICKDYNVKARIVSKGHLFKKCGANFEVFSPERVYADNSNDSSIIMKMDYQGSEWLFTGDASLEVLQNIEDPDADILKVSHHGDKKCTNSELVERVGPLASVISAGGIGGNGADTEVLEFLTERGRLFTTYENKTITFICDENGGIYFGKNKEPIKIGT